MRKALLALVAVASLLPLLGGEALAQPGINLPGSPFLPSGNPPVTSTLSAAGASSSFPPQAGRTFHIQLSGTAVANCYLERQLDGTNWVPLTVASNGTTTVLANWNYTGSSLSDDEVEPQSGVVYRVDCGAALGSFTSGSLSVRFSQ